MKPKTISFVCILGVAATLVFLSPQKATAREENSILPQDNKKVEQLLADRLKKKVKQGAFFILGIEQKLQSQREELKLLRQNIGTLEDKVDESHEQINNLETQLANLDNLIGKNKERVRAAVLLGAEFENGIQTLTDDINQQEKSIKIQIEALDEAMTAYYIQNNTFFDFGSGEPSLLAFLSSEDTSGDILQKNGYLYFMQSALQELSTKILRDQVALDDKKNELKEKKDELQKLQSLLNREQKTLTQAQTSRQKLLEDTKGRQAIYETLLELSKKEEEQVSVTITHLKENYAFFQAKLDDLKNLPQSVNQESFDLLSLDSQGVTLQKGDEPLAWPVPPNLGLSALYHDNEYKKALGVQHNAIDIRLAQGSKVKSAADGVVTKVADNGFAYSYIIISHPGKFMTLYGHLSDMVVSEGEIVRQGQTIGLSGGIPGTKGAGWLTTGAHLHFEVFKDFEHTDPLEYLPLEFVPVSSLPEKYLKRLTGEEDKVKRAPELSN